ncbi:GNAT family N-acetyltransferase [Streptomyces profundus]|uniref:GNAT family N-acetyltransferase n=1 Tax=Streptomyces profundus TaxID=2867410 RepID=UPI001D16A4EA|nr:GNAT family N-acetyltransferase [Streptomyces sp. MA3_2.13]UED83836.1 GNAT family N-acetyltransferase [Streptomyces sp. MA3_2.13]
MSTPAPVLRPATPDDLPAVAEIYAHYVAHTVATFDEQPPALDAWRIRLADAGERGLPFLVAETVAETAGEIAGEIAGYAYAGPWRPKPAYRHTVEDSVYLAPGRTGNGLGGLLLAALITGATEAGARQMVAVIADGGGRTSVGLHRRLGFAEVGRLVGVGHKHGRWVDTLLMQRPLAVDRAATG